MPKAKAVPAKPQAKAKATAKAKSGAKQNKDTVKGKSTSKGKARSKTVKKRATATEPEGSGANPGESGCETPSGEAGLDSEPKRRRRQKKSDA